MSSEELTSFRCRVCGEQIPVGNRFCGACGSEVSNVPPSPQDVVFQPYGRQRSFYRARRSGSARGTWFGLGIFFFCSLLFALGGRIPAFINLPGFRARFTGIETTALVSAVGDCDDGNYFMYTFTDNHGQVHQITDNSTCSSGIVSDGERVSLWYNPDDPTQFITANDMNFDLIFVIGFSIPLLICLVLCGVALVRQVLVRRTPGLVSLLV